MPHGPRRQARTQTVILVLLVAVLVLLAGTALLVPWFMNRTSTLAMWAFLLPSAVVCGSMIQPAWAVRANALRHSFSHDEHECQCIICGRTFTPPTSPAGQRPVRRAPPLERLHTTTRALRAIVAGYAVMGVLLVAQVWVSVSGNLGWESALIFQAIVSMLLGGGFLVAALVAVALRRAARRTQAEALQPHHCCCRWCGGTAPAEHVPAG